MWGSQGNLDTEAVLVVEDKDSSQGRSATE